MREPRKTSFGIPVQPRKAEVIPLGYETRHSGLAPINRSAVTSMFVAFPLLLLLPILTSRSDIQSGLIVVFSPVWGGLSLISVGLAIHGLRARRIPYRALRWTAYVALALVSIMVVWSLCVMVS